MVYRIKELSVDCSSRLITRDGTPVTVPKRAFDCLCILLQNMDRAVSREELIEKVWGHQDISDNQLSQLIVSLRRLVGDNGMRQRMIRTIPGYGYHWIGPVVEEQPMDHKNTESEMLDGMAESKGERFGRGRGFQIVKDQDQFKEICGDPGSLSDVSPEEFNIEKPRVSARSGAMPRILMALGLAAFVLLLIESLNSGDSTADATSSPDLKNVWVLPPEVKVSAEHAWLPVSLMSIVEDRLRMNGIGTVPIENVLSVAESDGSSSGESPETYYFNRFDAQLVVRIEAEKSDDFWNIRLTATPPSGFPTKVEHAGARLIETVVAVSDKLLIGLQYVPSYPGESRDTRRIALSEWIRQGNYSRARDEIAAMPSEIRTSSEIALMESRLDYSEGFYKRALERVEAVIDAAEMDVARDVLANALLLRASVRRALSINIDPVDLDTSIQLLREHGSRSELASAIFKRAQFRARLGQYDQASLDFMDARTLFDQLDDEIALADIGYELARMKMERAQHAEALVQVRNVKALYRKYHDLSGLAISYQLEIFLNSRLLRWSDASASCDSALELLERIDSMPLQERVLRRCASVAIETGALARANTLLDRIEDLHQNSEVNTKDRLVLEYYRVQLELARGRSEHVGKALRDLATDFLAVMNRLDRPEAQMKSNLERMLLLHQQARRTAAGIPPLPSEVESFVDAPETSSGYLARALWLKERNHPATEDALRAAIEMAERDRFPALIVSAADVLIELLLDQGRVQDAATQLDLLMAHNPEIMENDYTVALICLRFAASTGSEAQFERALRRVEALAGERPIPDQLIALAP